MVGASMGAAKLVAVVAAVAFVPVTEGYPFASAPAFRIVAVNQSSRSRLKGGFGFVAVTATF